jgi:heme exporter protein D
LYTAVQGQVPLSVLMGTYVVGAASCLFFWSGALLWSVTTSALGYLQPWAGAGFAAITVWGLMSIPSPFGSEDPMNWLWSFDPSIVTKHLMRSTYPRELVMNWFNLNCNVTPWITTLFITAYLSVWTAWIWTALRRRFQNARGTVLSKKQSYGFTACLMGSVTGFVWGGYSTTTLSLCMVICLVVVTLITPNRQTLHEWARYRHQMPRKSLISELLWGEKSPALMAVAVNMAIATVLLSPAIVRLSADFFNGILELVAFAIAVLMMAVIFQIMLMLKMPRPELWAVGSWMACWLVPVISTELIGFTSAGRVLWFFSIAPWLAVGSEPVITVLGALMVQLSVFGLLTSRLIRQLDRAGVSESKALLT